MLTILACLDEDGGPLPHAGTRSWGCSCCTQPSSCHRNRQACTLVNHLPYKIITMFRYNLKMSESQTKAGNQEKFQKF